MPIEAVILDVDGTLVDSNEAHVRAWQEALGSFGIDASLADVRRLVGMGGDQLLASIPGLESEAELREEISALRGRIFRENYLPDIRPWPDSVDLITRLHSVGLDLAVASSSDRALLDALLGLADPYRLVRVIVSSDDVQSSKPSPDLVLSALARLRRVPANVVLLGDTPYDVASAKASGVGTIAFRCGGWNDADLRGAIEVWDDPGDLLASWYRSALATQRARRAA
jgi:HAD superfamily hydrolase (TIGR01509 family)